GSALNAAYQICVGFKDWFCDRRGFRTMRARQNDQHSQMDLRWIHLAAILKRSSKTDEPSISAKTLWRHRGSRLAENVKRKRVESGAARSAVTHRTGHAFGND